MVLSIDGIQIQVSNLDDFYSTYPELFRKAQKLSSEFPVQTEPDGVIYVRQKYYALIRDGEKTSDGTIIDWIGTDDVLTCHVVILRLNDVTALGHFDEYVTSRTLDTMIQELIEKVRRSDEELWNDDDWEWDEYDEDEEVKSEDNKVISIRFIGGYCDEAGKAKRLGKRLFTYFHNHPITFNIEDCCLGTPNTRRGIYHNEPIISGVRCDIKTGKISRASFTSRSFLNELPDDLMTTLLLGPSLIKKPNRLKGLILAKEDKGYSL